MKIAEIVNRSDTRAGRIFDWAVIGLIVISIISISIDTLPDLPGNTREFFSIVELIILVLFTIEYCVRVATAPSKRGYIFSFFGIIDLLAIIPFYLSLGIVDLSSFRIVRVFRILRILKLSSYNAAMLRFGKAIALAKEEILLFGLLTLIMLYVSAVGIYYFEHHAQPEAFPSIVHSLWWATAHAHNRRIRRRISHNSGRKNFHNRNTIVRIIDNRRAGRTIGSGIVEGSPG